MKLMVITYPDWMCLQTLNIDLIDQNILRLFRILLNIRDRYRFSRSALAS